MLVRPRPQRLGSRARRPAAPRTASVVAGDRSACATASSPRRPRALPAPADGDAQGPEGLEDHRQADPAPRHAREGDRPAPKFGIDVQLRRAADRRRRARRRSSAARVKSFDDSGGEGHPGRAQGGAGAEPASPWSPTTSGPPKLGREALEVDWDAGPGAPLDTHGDARTSSAELAGPAGPRSPRARATSPAALAAAKRTRRGRLRRALPRARADGAAQLHGAHSDRDGCEIWTGTQFQTADQAAAAQHRGPEARAGDASTRRSSAAASAAARPRPRTS